MRAKCKILNEVLEKGVVDMTQTMPGNTLPKPDYYIRGGATWVSSLDSASHHQKGESKEEEVTDILDGLDMNEIFNDGLDSSEEMDPPINRNNVFGDDALVVDETVGGGEMTLMDNAIRGRVNREVTRGEHIIGTEVRYYTGVSIGWKEPHSDLQQTNDDLNIVAGGRRWQDRA